METIKGVLKVVIAIAAIGLGSELGKRGLKDIKISVNKKL